MPPTLLVRFVLIAALLLPKPAVSAEAIQCKTKVDVPERVLNHKVIVLGEQHGTNEIPQFVEGLVCKLIQTGKSVVIGLEMSTAEQPVIDAFMQSRGGAGDRQKLLATDFWQKGIRFGGNSVANANLIAALRDLKVASNAVDVFAFVDAPTQQPQSPGNMQEVAQLHEAAMTKRVAQSIRHAPMKTHVILVGGYHASKHKEKEFDPNHRSMSYLLSKEYPLMALRADFFNGSAWTCIMKKPTDKVPTCEAGQLSGAQSTTTKANQVLLFGTQKEQDTSGFDGVFAVGKISASPPAVPAP